MAAVLQTLKELHQLLVELADARQQLQRGPLQINGRQADLKRREEALAAKREALRAAKMASDRQELDLKSGEQRISDLQVKLNMAQSNKEYTALKDEIAKFEASNSLLADAILESITLQEEQAEEVKAAEADVEHAREEFAKFKETVEYKMEKFGSRVGLLDDEIKKYEGQLDSETRNSYRKISKSKGAADGLAACVDKICQACSSEVTSQNWNDLVMDRVVICKSCGAMLYK